MSTKVKEHWSWKLSYVHEDDILLKKHIEILLQNRGYKNTKTKHKWQMIPILTQIFKVEDKNIKPFHKLTIKQIKAELLLRNGSVHKTLKKEWNC